MFLYNVQLLMRSHYIDQLSPGTAERISKWGGGGGGGGGGDAENERRRREFVGGSGGIPPENFEI